MLASVFGEPDLPAHQRFGAAHAPSPDLYPPLHPPACAGGLYGHTQARSASDGICMLPLTAPVHLAVDGLEGFLDVLVLLLALAEAVHEPAGFRIGVAQ